MTIDRILIILVGALLVIHRMRLLIHIFNVAVNLRPLLDLVFLVAALLVFGPLTIVPTVLLFALLHRPRVLDVRLAYEGRIPIHSVAAVAYRLIWRNGLVILGPGIGRNLDLGVVVLAEHIVQGFVLGGIVGRTEVLLDVKATVVGLGVVGPDGGVVDVSSCPA